MSDHKKRKKLYLPKLNCLLIFIKFEIFKIVDYVHLGTVPNIFF